MNRLFTGRVRLRSNAAYTLLELMLALSLLGALMTVAWSLMGTFRDAEQRGWKLSHRTQTIRAAREWLQNDMQHLLQKELMPVAGTANSSRLRGNSLGFTATIAPSIDPLPFLEKLMSNPIDGLSPNSEREPVASLYSDAEAIVAQAQMSLWPAERLEVEYTLTPIEDSSATTESLASLQPMDLNELQFTLTRREMLDAGSVHRKNDSTTGSLQSANLADRVLTAQDLYRQTDETTQSSGLAIRETRLDGLTNVQFQYFDGMSWKREWNSDQTGGLPSAIALCFDFPAVAKIKPPEPKPATSSSDTKSGLTDSNDLLESRPVGSGMSGVDAVLAAEPTMESPENGESGLMQAATHEVQIVVYVGGQARDKGSSQALGPQRRDRANDRASARGGFE